MHHRKLLPVALVATADRSQLLKNALRSIMGQSHRPWRIVVVDDSINREARDQTHRVVDRGRRNGGDVELLHNRRSKGASGAWNSGIDHILRTSEDPASVYVAFLDDDDDWGSLHLEHSMSLVAQRNLDVVATPFERVEDGADPQLLHPPGSLDASSFLIGNPGIQGSNLVCRLPVLLDAGLFDEWLPSCTDRDVCIRIADLPGISYGTTAHPSVRHFASGNRQRLSTPGSRSKTVGLDRFFAKYRYRMSAGEESAFRKRAFELFDWQEARSRSVAYNTGPTPRLPDLANDEALPHLVVGVIADATHPERVGGLLTDLRSLLPDARLSGLDVLVLENGSDNGASEDMASLVERKRIAGLRVHLVDRSRHLRDAEAGLVLDAGVRGGRRLAIAPARTVLQSYLYAFVHRVPGAIVWIVDDDMRLDPLVVGEDGAARRQRLDVPALLHQLRRLRDDGELDVAIGGCTGAPPVPYAATVRVQLVDLVASLFWLASLAPEQVLPSRRGANAALRVERRDYYYDLSRNETDRLETPFLVEPAFDGERVGEAFHRLSRTAERILAGEQVFRPLVAGVGRDLVLGDGTLRGGNTFVLDVEALRDAPNPSLLIGQCPARRSDMAWALLQQRIFGRRVKSVAVALHHDRSGEVSSNLDTDRLVDDFRGYALVSALTDAPDAYRMQEGGELELVPESVDAVASLVKKYLDERLAAFRLSFYRVRGLARILRGLAADDTSWWRRQGEYRSASADLLAFADRIAGCYDLATLDRIEREARALDARDVRPLLERLRGEIDEHRRRVADPAPLIRSMEGERIVNAKAAVVRLTGTTRPLDELGCGAEGVALTDGIVVFKLFDYWKSWQTAATRAYLRSCVGAWPDAQRLYPLQAFHEKGHECVLVYPYEPSVPYTGGDGPGMVELMVECRRFGVVCRNIHPDNLRLAKERVRLIDYGSDIRPLGDDEKEFSAMCRRAWLSWRWPSHPRLKEIMRRSLTDTTLPELEGFEVFHQAVRRAAGLDADPEDIAFQLVGEAESVLDYGCGAGRLAKRLADLGTRVVGYDPDTGRGFRWDALSAPDGNLWFTHDRREALAAGLFATVVCRRVLCTVEDDEEMDAILRDLHGAARPDGRVIVTLCNPHATFAGPSLEADREVPEGAGYGDRFVWQKHVRASGRIRRDVHRPERFLQRAFARAGLAVRRGLEEPTIDLDRFERIADHVAYELVPLPSLPDVALLVKACAMEASTIEVQVRHLVAQLEEPRAFGERILVLDAREEGFLRQHTGGSLEGLRRAACRLVHEGWIDRVVEGPPDGAAAAALNERWFGLGCTHGHTASGAQLASILAGFESCTHRHVLQVDADVMVARLDRDHDYLADMLGVLREDDEAFTVAFNIAVGRNRPYTHIGPKGPWRVEARAALIDLDRLKQVLPLPNELDGERLALAWHRSLDKAIAAGRGRSYRGGSKRTFYVHPPNSRKQDRGDWFAVLDRIEHGFLPLAQTGEVEWVGTASDWLGPLRREPFVFVVCGRNVPAGRMRRCFASMDRQGGPQWGAVVIDDASDPAKGEHFETECAALGDRCTILRNRVRRGALTNLVTAIRWICTDPDTVIVVLDADDALVGHGVLERLAAEYARGADVTVGSMLRTDKVADYPVRFDRPREHRGGNVWQHLRSFRKRLFDAIPDPALRLDGSYVHLATDWAYMLPIVEMAAKPVHIREPLYLHEPSGVGKGAYRTERDAIIARIVAKEATAPDAGDYGSGTTP